MKFGILGAGNIANLMGSTVSRMDEVECRAIGARDLGRAQKMAKEYGFEKAYGSYEELVADEEIDLIYIATPHSHHYEHAKLCLEQGKHVLCEKAFTVNTAQAEELMKLAKSKKLLITEAIWTRYMPSRAMIKEVLDSGIIGKVTSMTANLGYVVVQNERMHRPELAGGALLDLGVYPLNFALMAFGDEIEEIHGHAMMTEEGVDSMDSITVTWKDGKMAVLHTNMLAQTDREGVIFGDKGYMEVQNINNCEEIRIYDMDRTCIQTIPVPEQITGYEYEVRACAKAIAEGRLECDEMPHSETLRVMNIMDNLRKEWGMKFPCE